MGAYAVAQRIAIYSLDWAFTSFVNIGHINKVGVIETLAKAFEQIFEARISVRLHHGVNASCQITTLGNLTRGLEHSGNLDRVMAIIINNINAIPIADMGKAALHPFKVFQALSDIILRQAQLARDCNCREHVLRIMLACHRQEHIGPNLILAFRAAKHHIKSRAGRL